MDAQISILRAGLVACVSLVAGFIAGWALNQHYCKWDYEFTLLRKESDRIRRNYKAMYSRSKN